MSKRGIAAYLALAALLCIVAPARAHNGNSKYVDVATTGQEAAVTLRVHAIDAAAATGMGVDIDAEELRRRASVVAAWLTRGISVEAGGVGCAVSHTEPYVDGKGLLAIDAHYRCGDGAMTLRDDSLDAGDTAHTSLVHIAGGETKLLRGSDNAVLIAAAVPSALATARTFFIEGGIHLVTGYDHMLFLLSLLFAAGVLAHRRGKRVALADIALVVTAFTLGHSITLVLASLELVSLPSRLVEAVIAASIVAVAAMNVLRPESTHGRPWAALGFGLVHGFGFSSVLADVGLPAGQRAIALASFNVGIEVTQLLFVAIVILPLAWLARHERLYRTAVMRAGSLAIAAMASFWVVERVLGA